jgi:hypothetical protein
VGNNYRNDDYKPYLFVSKDLGLSWQLLQITLPQESINVIKEDARFSHILYLGTDKGLYISYDTGKTWSVFSEKLPRVAVHDLAIQSREADLVIGTHGRGIWIAQTEYILQSHPDSLIKNSLTFFTADSIAYNEGWGESWSKWLDTTTHTFSIHVLAAKANALKVTLRKDNNEQVSSYTFSKEDVRKGWNELPIPLKASESKEHQESEETYLKPGNYTLEISDGITSLSKKWVIYKP